MKDKIGVRFIKGFVIGASMLVPGASGGTMAIILGIYDELIHAVGSFREDVKRNGMLLLQYGIAGILGVILLSGVMLKALELYQQPLLFFFLGAILGSLPPLYRKATISRLKFSNVVFCLIGVLSGISLMFLPEGVFVFGPDIGPAGLLLLFLAGIIIAVALVLPGISASYVLLMLGLYTATLNAIKDVDLVFLVPIILGALVGTFLTADILEKAMNRHPQFTYMLIMGFMLGSLVEVFPGLPVGIDWLWSGATFVAGGALTLLIGRSVR